MSHRTSSPRCNIWFGGSHHLGGGHAADNYTYLRLRSAFVCEFSIALTSTSNLCSSGSTYVFNASCDKLIFWKTMQQGQVLSHTHDAGAGDHVSCWSDKLQALIHVKFQVSLLKFSTLPFTRLDYHDACQRRITDAGSA